MDSDRGEWLAEVRETGIAVGVGGEVSPARHSRQNIRELPTRVQAPFCCKNCPPISYPALLTYIFIRFVRQA